MARSNIDSSAPDIAAANERYPQLRKNQVKLSKDQLTAIKSDLTANGKSSEKLDRVLDHFDTIDINGNGLTSDELLTYTKAGITSDGANDSTTTDSAQSQNSDSTDAEDLLADAAAASEPSPAPFLTDDLAAELISGQSPSLLDYLDGSYNSDGSLSDSLSPSALLSGIKA